MARATITKVRPIGKPYKSQGVLKIVVIRKNKRLKPILVEK